jgi:hypothetical protein
VQTLGRLLRLAVTALLPACMLPEVSLDTQASTNLICSVPTGAQCELMSDCGCAGDQTCRVDGTVSGRTACGGVGAVLNFEPCSKESDCARGADCIGGLCKPYCQSDADCFGLPGQCAEIQTVHGTVQGVRVCGKGALCAVPAGGACELMSDCGCTGAQTCRVVAAVTGRTECGPIGPMGAFEPCSSEADCARQLDCIGGVCKPYCVSDADCTLGGGGRCGVISTNNGDVPGARACSGAIR